jgi:glutaredoxin-related protein
VFTTAVCTHCARAKAALTAATVAYVEIDVGEDVELLKRLKAFTGRGTVPQVRAKLFATAKLIERCCDGVEDQGADEALWGQERIVTSVSEAVSRASGSAFTAGKRWVLGVGAGRLCCACMRGFARSHASEASGPVRRLTCASAVAAADGFRRQVFVGAECVGGADETVALIASGELQTRLDAEAAAQPLPEALDASRLKPSNSPAAAAAAEASDGDDPRFTQLVELEARMRAAGAAMGTADRRGVRAGLPWLLEERCARNRARVCGFENSPGGGEGPRTTRCANWHARVEADMSAAQSVTRWPLKAGCRRRRDDSEPLSASDAPWRRTPPQVFLRVVSGVVADAARRRHGAHTGGGSDAGV